MRKASKLRKDLQDIGADRASHQAAGDELDNRLTKLLGEAHEHPEITMAEAARLAGLKRRATAYSYLGRRKHG